METDNKQAESPQLESNNNDPTIHVLESGEQVLTTERICKDVEPPANFIPTNDQVFNTVDGKSIPNTIFLKDFFFREGRLTVEQASKILEVADHILRAEPTLLDLDAPLTGSNY